MAAKHHLSTANVACRKTLCKPTTTYSHRDTQRHTNIKSQIFSIKAICPTPKCIITCWLFILLWVLLFGLCYCVCMRIVIIVTTSSSHHRYLRGVDVVRQHIFFYFFRSPLVYINIILVSTQEASLMAILVECARIPYSRRETLNRTKDEKRKKMMK